MDFPLYFQKSNLTKRDNFEPKISSGKAKPLGMCASFTGNVGETQFRQCPFIPPPPLILLLHSFVSPLRMHLKAVDTHNSLGALCWAFFPYCATLSLLTCPNQNLRPIVWQFLSVTCAILNTKVLHCEPLNYSIFLKGSYYSAVPLHLIARDTDKDRPAKCDQV